MLKFSGSSCLISGPKCGVHAGRGGGAHPSPHLAALCLGRATQGPTRGAPGALARERGNGGCEVLRARGARENLPHHARERSTGRAAGGTSLNLRRPRRARTPVIHNPRGVARGKQTLKQVCSQEYPGSAMCVQRFDDSLSSAIRITYRISLRSSSLREPRHPMLKVVFR